MKAKFIQVNELSVRGDNDHERILLKNFNDISLTKEAKVELAESGDLIITLEAPGDNSGNGDDNA